MPAADNERGSGPVCPRPCRYICKALASRLPDVGAARARFVDPSALLLGARSSVLVAPLGPHGSLQELINGYLAKGQVGIWWPAKGLSPFQAQAACAADISCGREDAVWHVCRRLTQRCLLKTLPCCPCLCAGPTRVLGHAPGRRPAAHHAAAARRWEGTAGPNLEGTAEGPRPPRQRPHMCMRQPTRLDSVHSSLMLGLLADRPHTRAHTCTHGCPRR